uniref:Uncharacterized protein n=1 Tax=Heliothis virescens TaxID=7102 RepID=A0A2A4JQP5_HELVI
MSTKIASSAPPCSSDRCKEKAPPKGILQKTDRTQKSAPKKVLTSKISSCMESKSCSSGVSTKKCTAKPKKLTKSDSTVTVQKSENGEVVDYCKKCGDGKSTGEVRDKIGTIVSAMNVKCVKNDNRIKKISKKSSKPVQQYYKNENFYIYDESSHETPNKDNKKQSLDTIKEVSEMHSASEDSIFRIFSDSEEEVTFIDPSSDENIKKLKEFREKNYFECHSAKSRIKSKVSATSLNEHKCVYRFYLNERLFPVPLNTDYNNKVRCVECQLPMDIKQESSSDKINGTIQAKVKIGASDTQDMLLLLPVKDSLIIEERRKENRQKSDYVYFGVVKLSPDGQSIFNRTLPENSLALKYQKGYQEYQDDGRFHYKEIKDDDVIII